MQLTGTVGILTGASRGIGIHLAEALARKGVSLALAARSEQALKETANKIESVGARALIVPTDVTNNADLERLVERTQRELGPVDLLVNNAGIERYEHFHLRDIDDIETTLRTNLIAAEILTRLVVPSMIERRRGHIVNVSSVAGKAAVPYNVVYSSSKHALVGFSWGLRAELAAYGVGVSVICPGYVRDAGMFADRHRDREPPRTLPTVTPSEVAARTIDAIENDRAEVVVTKGMARLSDLVHALSPRLAMAIGRKSGAYAFLRQDADETH